MSGNTWIALGIICGAIGLFSIPYGFYLKLKETSPEKEPFEVRDERQELPKLTNKKADHNTTSILELEDVIGKPIKLIMKTGEILEGEIQNPVDERSLKTTVSFVTVENRKKMIDLYGNKSHVSIPYKEAKNFVDFIKRSQIKGFKLVETTLENIFLVTEGGKKIEIDGLK